MICPVCFGRKYDFKKDGNSGYFVECKKCHGTGKIEVTNDEWRRTCSTEEFATVIYGIAMYDTLYDRIHNAFVLNPCEDDSAGINEVVKWLKEKHEPLKNDKK